ncbi:hypothetical protein NSQ91_28435 [Paenibacillus sp. FSL R7-0048]|uniref:hypothetical protein n=1 Tax=Paenibacillus TaxID=44249 RepID=UPI00096BDEE7|nr:hypothetical protein [Paenibacillus odorifer]OMD67386.1 hypothetical protein BSK48_20005 [Paenibacillus odorifer]OMD78642.1 hypothetical protein BSK53_23505 [Paenibacillus odorifer]
METVQKSIPDMDIPYYIPCLYPLINMWLNANRYDIGINLLTNHDLLSVPTFALDRTDLRGEVYMWDVQRLGRQYLQTKLGLTLEFIEIEESAKQDYLHRYLKQDNCLIMGGTTYHLPQSKDYHSRHFVDNIVRDGRLMLMTHWLAVTGGDFTSYQLYDPVPNKFQGDIDGDNLMQFWKGLRYIPEISEFEDVKEQLVNGVCHVHMDKKRLPDKQVLARDILREIIQIHYHRGPVREGNRDFYYGINALQQLGSFYRDAITQVLDVQEREALWKCFFDLKFSFHFLRLLFEEFSEVEDALLVEKIKSDLDELIVNIIKLSSIMQANRMRGKHENYIQSKVEKSLEQIMKSQKSLLLLMEGL